jgi:asparagine N-glycosylation enzyme membrane subunit Stt3
LKTSLIFLSDYKCVPIKATGEKEKIQKNQDIMTGTKSNKNNASKEEDETTPVTTPASSPMEAVYASLRSPAASAIYVVFFLNLLYRACVEAYNIRLYAINEYGRVIHEFDPYFNYRAAEVRKKNKK